jgi:hypothetical protein
MDIEGFPPFIDFLLKKDEDEVRGAMFIRRRRDLALPSERPCFWDGGLDKKSRALDLF